MESVESTAKKKPHRRRGDGTLRLRGRIWWIAFRVNGKQEWESSGSEKEKDARELLRRRLGEIAADQYVPTVGKTLVSELCDLVTADYRRNGNDTTAKAERFSKRFKEYFGTTKAQDVVRVTGMIDKYIDQRQSQGESNASINRQLAFLKRAYSLGLKKLLVTMKPAITMLEEDNVRTGFFEFPQYVMLKSELAEWLRDPFIFAFFNPWREENIFELTWSQVDSLNWTVRVEAGETKAEQAIEIGLDGECLEMIKRRFANRGNNPLVFHRDGKKIGDFRNEWYRACCQVGLGQWVEVERKGKKALKYAGKLFHDLRRTAGRNHVRAGTGEKVVMGLGGWKTRSTFDRYNIVSTKDLKEAAIRMTSYIDGQEEKLRARS